MILCILPLEYITSITLEGIEREIYVRWWLISRFEEEKVEIPFTYGDTWRKTNNIPDSDAIEPPAEFE